MLNFRKLKQDFSSNIIKEGKQLHQMGKVLSAKIIRLENDLVRIAAKVAGNYGNTYESELEIDRFESQVVHSNCDCPYRYDCQHLAALIFYIEEKLDALVVDYSKETNITTEESGEQQELLKTIEQAKNKAVQKRSLIQKKQVLQEYKNASMVLSHSPFFLASEESSFVQADLMMVFNPHSLQKKSKKVEFQLALRLPFRSKPLQIASLGVFMEALRYEESILIGGKRYLFSLRSFSSVDAEILQLLLSCAEMPNAASRVKRSGFIPLESFGLLLSLVYDHLMKQQRSGFVNRIEETGNMPSIFSGNLETPLKYSYSSAFFRFNLEYIDPPYPKILIKPTLLLGQDEVNMEEVCLFSSSMPGLVYEHTFFCFPKHIKRTHIKQIMAIREMTIPEPLFGTFVEDSLPELRSYGEVAHLEVIDKFTTLPFTGDMKAICHLSYLDGELDATLEFVYDGHKVPATPEQLMGSDIESFVGDKGILARNLAHERKIMEELFQDFVCDGKAGVFSLKVEKKIVEFMTGTVPKNQHRITFHCPENLLEQFIYDQTTFTLSLDLSRKVGHYKLNLQVEGPLKGVKVDLLWDCIVSKRSFIELQKNKGGGEGSRFSRILVIDLTKMARLVQIFDELGIVKLSSCTEDRPLWSLMGIEQNALEDLPITLSLSPQLEEVRQQILGKKTLALDPMPKGVNADLRSYQKEGVDWLSRLRKMHLNGVLADDMGLGKTLQAITAVSQMREMSGPSVSIIVCPTSLLYNWKEEFARFNPTLKVVVIDGLPQARKKMIDTVSSWDVVVTSYTLLQKDIAHYEKTLFAYVILDEAQHIKNRGTRNAKSVKMIQSHYRVALSGTPIENSLEDLWSIFDFLMPGLLSSFERFSEKYIRSPKEEHAQNVEHLRCKIAPFILRRMKEDVLKELPPVEEIEYHCALSDVQKQLYASYARSARDELEKLVERDGFEKVHIHVLATLTRLKQICCHPAIFAKEKAEPNDSAKYELLLELLQTLVEGKHKTVIFSQYTRMLQIMRSDFMQKGIRFSYLDGSSKNRLQIVKEFNEDPNIPVFLVSLKAGGTGLNLVGADTVIHYDMWWNPAVESQATDRVHRMGQQRSVSSYKLITQNTIEKKIVEMQKRKKGLVKKVVSCDDEMISKLTWEDVLELLQA
ncbi:MAG: SNF2-related protein [Chlamydiota bacterium]